MQSVTRRSFSGDTIGSPVEEQKRENRISRLIRWRSSAAMKGEFVRVSTTTRGNSFIHESQNEFPSFILLSKARIQREGCSATELTNERTSSSAMKGNRKRQLVIKPVPLLFDRESRVVFERLLITCDIAENTSFDGNSTDILLLFRRLPFFLLPFRGCRREGMMSTAGTTRTRR